MLAFAENFHLMLIYDFQVISKYKSLDEYLKVVDGYLDIVLQKQMVSCMACDLSIYTSVFSFFFFLFFLFFNG